jgi:DnaJ-domain-containing protein 1
MQLMCCDGSIDDAEKKFLASAAKQMDVQIDNWNDLLKSTLKDNVPLYPIADDQCAIATLKALVVMAKADTYVDNAEKQFIQKFAKSIGISNDQWKEILQNIDPDNLFTPFNKTRGKIVVLKDDFDKIDMFLSVTQNHGVETHMTELSTFLDGSQHTLEHIVCFHAAPDKEQSLARCAQLLSKTGDRLIAILTRYQGLQVKYMHELGLKKCIIEPVYSQDIMNLFK